MDAKSGYWMVKLDMDSSLLTTFNTPWGGGGYRWLCLPFGLSVSSDVFQEKLDAILKPVPNVTGLADNVLAKGDSEQIHDTVMLNLLDTASSNNIKFNPRKLQFKTQQCKFFGHFLTPKGILIDPQRVDAINCMEPPQSKKELDSFQDKRYSNNLTKLAEALKELLREDTLWCWESNFSRKTRCGAGSPSISRPSSQQRKN